MSDTWIRIGRYAVVVVGVIVAAISFSHIRDLALDYGGDSLTAPLLPLGIDGAVAAMTVFMHQASGAALWLSRFGLLVAIGMTVAFNTAYGAAFGVTGAVVWSSPAVLLVICIEVSVLTVRRAQPVSAPDKPAVNQPVAERPEASLDNEGTDQDGRRHAASLDPVTMPVVTEELNAMAAKVTVRKPSKAKQARIAKVRRLLEQSPDLTVPQIAARVDCHPRTVARDKAELAMANGNGKH